jgi:UDP-N-acetylglucosamine enolpyruvyl transferase
MAKQYRRLQRVSTIPILAALLLSANPAAAVNIPDVRDISQTDSTADISIPLQDTSNSRLRSK